MGKVETLERRYSDLCAQASKAVQLLDQVRARLRALPGELVEAKDGARAALAEEFGRLSAQERLGAAEVRELERRAGGALVALCEFKADQAQAELTRFDAEVYRPALDARDQAIEALRIAQNRPDRLGIADRREIAQEVVRLRVAKEERIAQVAHVIAPQVQDLRLARDVAREDLDAARRELEEIAGRVETVD